MHRNARSRTGCSRFDGARRCPRCYRFRVAIRCCLPYGGHEVGEGYGSTARFGSIRIHLLFDDVDVVSSTVVSGIAGPDTAGLVAVDVLVVESSLQGVAGGGQGQVPEIRPKPGLA